MKVQHLVVGSGAGGATTAAILAAAGLDVLVLEEGPKADTGSMIPFSLDQMRLQYRSLGQLAALGTPPIAYAEGRCVGGSTEINSGLYHRPSEALLAQWRDGWDIRDLDAASLAPTCAAIEQNLHVSSFPDGVPPASQLLSDGARALGWQAQEIPRWFSYDSPRTGMRQSMSRTYLAQAEHHGAIVQPNSWVRRLVVIGGRARSAEVEQHGRIENVEFDNVWVCGGAVQSAALLLRSGIKRNVGRTLSMHPTVKAVAVTPGPVNDPRDVPVVQVREFAPHMSLGGSAANLPMLGLALLRTRQPLDHLARTLTRMPIYYAAIQSQGGGRVRAVPGLRDPLVTYRLTSADLHRLRQAMARLLQVLLAAGVDAAIPSVAGGDLVTAAEDVPREIAKLTRRTADVMTVHVCSSVPMGEDRDRCAVDSWGRSHEVAGLAVNDASILNSAPGINPQGTVMALAARNVEHSLAEHGVPLPDREHR